MTMRQVCFLVNDYLFLSGIATLPQPTYRRDLAPVDFFLFPRVKTALKGDFYETVAQVNAASNHCLKDAPENNSQNTFRRLTTYWRILIIHSDIFNAYFFLNSVSLLFVQTLYITIDYVVTLSEDNRVKVEGNIDYLKVE